MSICEMTEEEFKKSVIAQDDDEDWQESGYVAWIRDGVAYLASYSHCSCFGTISAITDSTRDWSKPEKVLSFGFRWSGTPDELVDIAKRRADFAMPDRPADEEDYDYDHLAAVYSQIVAWDEGGRQL